MLRLVRIALLISVSFVAGASISGCSDDTTNTNATNDLSAGVDLKPAADMAGPHDLANHD